MRPTVFEIFRRIAIESCLYLPFRGCALDGKSQESCASSGFPAADHGLKSFVPQEDSNSAMILKTIQKALAEPIDVAILVYFRLVFGGIMVWEMGRYIALDRVAYLWAIRCSISSISVSVG
ncbi:MAG: hypothetical protein ACI9R3_000782 [Verrucomicrobiales bacterium]|jgi:hypothetical protein